MPRISLNKRKFNIILLISTGIILQLSFINCGTRFESTNAIANKELTSEEQSSNEFINTEMEINNNSNVIIDQPSIDSNNNIEHEETAPNKEGPPATLTIENQNIESNNNTPSIQPNIDGAFTISTAKKITNNTATFGTRHFYSTRSSFNADSTLIVLQEGSEGTTLARDQIIFNLEGNRISKIPINLDVIWSRLNPNILFGIIESGKNKYEFVKYNIKSKEITKYYTSTKYFELGHRKGTLSYDERYIAIATNDDGKEYRVFDLVENKLIAKTKNNRTGTSGLGLYMSPSGNYVLAVEEDNEKGGTSFFRYDRNLKNRTFLTRNSNHNGLNINSKGEDILVINGVVEIINVKTKQIIKGFNNNTPIYGHVSGTGLPGQFILSGKINGDRQIIEINSDHGQDAFKKRIFWGDLKDKNAISYRALAKPNISPDGRFVIYTEDYKDGTNKHDEFIIEKKFD